MASSYIVGEPGGPAGPFYSVVDFTGEVIALQVPDRQMARRIANIPIMLETIDRKDRTILELEAEIARLQARITEEEMRDEKESA